MATVGTIKLYESGNSGSSYSKQSDSIAYLGRISSSGSSKYRSYYEIPVVANGDTITCLTLKTNIRVSNGGNPTTNSIYARLYTTQADVRAHNDNYLQEKVILNKKFNATGKSVSFIFDEITTQSETYYVALFTDTTSETKALEVDGRGSKFEVILEVNNEQPISTSVPFWFFEENSKQWIEGEAPYVFDGQKWIKAEPYRFNGTVWVRI